MNIYLIAKKLSHSFSKPIHNKLADYSYEYKELEEESLREFFQKREFDGLNVTIPYKKAVMEFLDEISEKAQRIGAVNTVTNKGGRLCGYNTDYYGFCYEIKESGADIKGKDAVVLGNGGAAKTVICVLEDLGAKSVRVVNSTQLRSGDVQKYLDAQIVVNATPVGMYPNTGTAVVDINKFTKCEAVLDLIYNPAKTQLILDAEKMGIKTANGLGMLVAQAKKACEIFTDATVDDMKIDVIRREIEDSTKNIVLVGMPGCGKSTVGKELAERLEREFYDCDEEITKRGQSPAELIEKYGEDYFREVETQVLSELCKKSGCVIATGGGAVTMERNYDIIHQNAIVVFIKRDIESLATNGRPLSQGGGDRLLKMYEVRYPLYKKFSHLCVESQNTWQETTALIIEKLNKR
ncbi:MAG: hypothetical protein IJZ81_01785 [Clostridia bacterium]|nr:hypothetical protein [Clostridia bacterium]